MTFEEVYNNYYNKVLGYLRKHTDSLQDAEDLANQAFMSCYEKFDSYDSTKAAVSTWLFVIVKNALKNYYRGKKYGISLDDPDNGLNLSDGSEMEKAAELTVIRKEIAKALESLDEDKRRVVILKYFSDKSTREIAEQTGFSEANVRVILNRSLHKLKDYFDKRNMDWSFE